MRTWPGTTRALEHIYQGPAQHNADMLVNVTQHEPRKVGSSCSTPSEQSSETSDTKQMQFWKALLHTLHVRGVCCCPETRGSQELHKVGEFRGPCKLHSHLLGHSDWSLIIPVLWKKAAHSSRFRVLMAIISGEGSKGCR